MPGETVSSAVSSAIDNLFSPTVLFFLLNLMIASIAISSKLSSSSSDNNNDNDNDDGTSEHEDRYQQQQQQHGEEEEEEEERAPPISNSDPPTEPLSRSPSLLGRFRLFDIGSRSMRRQEHESVEAEHQQETEQRVDEGHSNEEVYRNITVDDARKENRDGELQSRMRRSWSIRSDSGRYQLGESSGQGGEVVERRRPASAREWREDEEEVDARADDFINRFKQQLRLQRMESLTRYRAMMGLSARN